MLKKYSSRRKKLDKSFLNHKLSGAKAYDRIAGYFSSSILELASEELENMEVIKWFALVFICMIKDEKSPVVLNETVTNIDIFKNRNYRLKP